MKRTLAVAAVASVMALTLVGQASPANAEYSPGCVTKSEYRHLSKGMTARKVHILLETKGKIYASKNRYHVRGYDACWSTRGFVMIAWSYENRLLAKDKTRI